MTEISLLTQQIDVLKKEMDINKKTSELEFERISKAFGQLGNLLDLLYLEVSVLIETLGEKEVINLKEFQKSLEETAEKIEKQLASTPATDGILPAEGPN